MRLYKKGNYLKIRGRFEYFRYVCESHVLVKILKETILRF